MATQVEIPQNAQAIEPMDLYGSNSVELNVWGDGASLSIFSLYKGEDNNTNVDYFEVETDFSNYRTEIESGISTTYDSDTKSLTFPDNTIATFYSANETDEISGVKVNIYYLKFQENEKDTEITKIYNLSSGDEKDLQNVVETLLNNANLEIPEDVFEKPENYSNTELSFDSDSEASSDEDNVNNQDSSTQDGSGESNTDNQAQYLSLGSSVEGVVEANEDGDYYKVSLEANKAYKIIVDSQDWMYIEVEDNNHNYIWENVFYGGGKYEDDSYETSIILTPEQENDYYIRVDDEIYNDTSYTIKMEEIELTQDNFADSVSEAYALTLGEDYTGKIDTYDDEDYYKLYLEEGKTYLLSADTYNISADFVDKDGNSVWYDGIEWINKGMIFTPEESKDYYFKIQSWTIDVDYTLSSQELNLEEDGFANSVEEAYKVSLDNDGTYNANDDEDFKNTIDNLTDVDYFKVDLKAGEIYEVTTGSWEFDIEVVDENGNYLWDDTIGWTDQGRVIRPEEDKTYIFKISSYGEIGEYDLSIKTAQKDSIGDTIASSSDFNELAENNILTDKLDTSYDMDVLKVSAEVGKVYEIKLDTQNWANLDVVDKFGNYLWEEVETNWNYENGEQEVLVTFTPKDTADYYLKISGGEGEYTLSYKEAGESDLKADDHPDALYGSFGSEDIFDLSQTTKDSKIGTLETTDDKDLFKLDVTKDNVYVVSLLATENIYPYVDVVDSEGNWVDTQWLFDDNGDVKQKLSFTPEKDGDYYLKVSGWDITGDYELSVEKIEVANDDHPNSIDGITDDDIIKVGTSQKAELTLYDKDYFQIEVEAGKTYDLKLTSDENDFWPYIDIIKVDENGYEDYQWDNVQWPGYSQEDVKSELLFTPDEDGVYYIKVDSYDAGKYELSVSEVNLSDDHANSVSEISQDDEIVLGEEVSAQLETSLDEDYFKLTAESEHRYSITLDSDDIWPYIDVIKVDENGYEDYQWENIDWQWEEGVVSKLVFTPEEAGDYFIRVDSWESGSYTLKVEDAGSAIIEGDEFNDDVTDDFSNDQTITSLEAQQADGITLEGSLQTDFDKDIIKLDLEKDNTYELTLSSEDDGFWPYLDVLDSNGNYVWDSQVEWVPSYEDGVSSKLVFTPSVNSTYYLRVDSWESGDYKVNVKMVDIDNDDHANNIQTVKDTDIFKDLTTQAIQKDGELETSYDKDFFKLEAKDGEAYEIKLTSDDAYFWPNAEIVDSDGNSVWEGINWEWDPDAKTDMIFEPTKAGDYYIKVSGWEEGQYTLNVSKVDISPDLVADEISDNNPSITTDGVVKNGTLETSFDKDVFKFSVTAGKEYVITLDSDDISPYMNILEASEDGSEDYVWEGVSWEWDADVKNKVIFTPTATKDYYLQVDGYESGDYAIAINELVDDYASDISSVGADEIFDFSNETEVTKKGELEVSSDEDYFKLTSDGKSEYEILLKSNDTYPYVDILDNDGNYIWDERVSWQYNADDNVVTSMIFSPTTSEDFYLKVSGWETGKYELEINKITPEPDDHANSIDEVLEADVISVNDNSITKSGKLGTSDDVDYFKLETTKGETYSLSLSTADGTWPYLDVLDSDGNYVWDEVYWEWKDDNDDNPNTNITSSLTLEASSDVYYIKVDGWDKSQYELNITKQEAIEDDYANTIATATTVVGIDDSGINGQLETSRDKDVFKLEVSKGEVYEIDLSSTKNNWSYLDILDSEGNYLWENVQWQWKDDGDNDSSTNITSSIILTSEIDGTYFLKVSGGYADNVDYNLKVSTLDIEKDDHANSISEISEKDVVTLAKEIQGSLETAIDEDYFALNVEEGKIYEILLDSDDSYPYVDILDGEGNYLWENITWDWSQDYVSKIYFNATENEEVYLKVDGWEASDYTLKVSEATIENDNIANTVEDAKESDAIVLSDGVATIKDTLDTSFDTDVFKIDAQENHTYTIALSGSDDNWPYLDILNGNGDYVWDGVEWQWQDGYSTYITFTPSKTDEFFIKVDDWQSGDYELTITDTQTVQIEDDYTSDVSTTAEVVVDATDGLSGKLETANDEDWIKVSLQAGNVYDINVESSNTDVIINGVYDTEGNYIANSFDDDSGSGLNAKTSIKADATGDYYISVSGYNIGDYSVSVEKSISSDKEAATTATIASTTLNNIYSGEIDYSYDEDWIKVNLEAGKTYNVDVSGVTLEDTVINGIYDSTGKLMKNSSNDDANSYTLDSHVDFSVTQDGDYYISVSGFDQDTGTYDLAVSVKESAQAETLEDVEGADINNAVETAIEGGAFGEYTQGIIDYSGDTDMFKYDLVAGKTYEIAMFGSQTEHGTLPDTVIEGIYDSEGKLIAGTEDDNGGVGTDSLIQFTPETTGSYYVKTAGQDTLTGSFDIKVSEVIDTTDVEIAPVSSGYTENDGSWTIMVYIAADNNLEEYALQDINEMEAANLPENVNVTFLLDRNDNYSTAEGDWSGTKQGVISHDNDEYSISSLMEDIGEQNTGDGETLTNFIDWSVQTATADNYALVVWNHGGGIDGVAWDETSGYDNLTLNEMSNAIANSLVNQFDVIGFDACLQGVIDQSYSIKDSADIVVASEDLEPGDGWDYEGWLNSLSSDEDGQITAEEMGSYIVDSYEMYYENVDGTTLSAVDTSELDSLKDAFKKFNDQISNLSASELGELKTKLSTDVEHFGVYDEYIDLGSLAEVAQSIEGISTEATALETEINEAVVANYSENGEATGISVYFPGFVDQNYIDNFQIAQETDIVDLYQLA